MTNKELIEILEQYPDDMPVGFFGTYLDETDYGAVGEVEEVRESYLGDSECPTSVKCLELRH